MVSARLFVLWYSVGLLPSSSFGPERRWAESVLKAPNMARANKLVCCEQGPVDALLFLDVHGPALGRSVMGVAIIRPPAWLLHLDSPIKWCVPCSQSGSATVSVAAAIDRIEPMCTVGSRMASRLRVVRWHDGLGPEGFVPLGRKDATRISELSFDSRVRRVFQYTVSSASAPSYYGSARRSQGNEGASLDGWRKKWDPA